MSRIAILQRISYSYFNMRCNKEERYQCWSSVTLRTDTLLSRQVLASSCIFFFLQFW